MPSGFISGRMRACLVALLVKETQASVGFRHCVKAGRVGWTVFGSGLHAGQGLQKIKECVSWPFSIPLAEISEYLILFQRKPSQLELSRSRS